MSARIDLTGKRFGRLTVLGFSHVKNRKAYWSCQCDCGATNSPLGGNLRRGRTKSCGCQEHRFSATHGMCETPEYHIWENIISHCYNPRNAAYHIYSSHGITVQDSWRFGENGKTDAECFLSDIIEDIGRRPITTATMFAGICAGCRTGNRR
jgi:hypothetical protein